MKNRGSTSPKKWVKNTKSAHPSDLLSQLFFCNFVSDFESKKATKFKIVLTIYENAKIPDIISKFLAGKLLNCANPFKILYSRVQATIIIISVIR